MNQPQRKEKFNPAFSRFIKDSRLILDRGSFARQSGSRKIEVQYIDTSRIGVDPDWTKMSRSGCMINRWGETKHTLDCSCDDEYGGSIV